MESNNWGAMVSGFGYVAAKFNFFKISLWQNCKKNKKCCCGYADFFKKSLNMLLEGKFWQSSTFEKNAKNAAINFKKYSKMLQVKIPLAICKERRLRCSKIKIFRGSDEAVLRFLKKMQKLWRHFSKKILCCHRKVFLTS